MCHRSATRVIRCSLVRSGMLRILDRYLVREIAAAASSSALVVLTFVLMMPPILQQGEQLIAKGVDWSIIVARAADAAARRRLSSRFRWRCCSAFWSASGACRPTASSWRCRRAASASSACCGRSRCSPSWRPAATAYETIVALPDANQTFREITFNVVASGVESDIKPRVFFRSFPNRVLYVRDIPPGGGWRDVFLADTTQPDRDDGLLRAARAGWSIDREKRMVQLVLEDGTSHTTYADTPDAYDGSAFERADARHGRRRPCSRGRSRQGRQRDDDRRAARRRSPRTPRTGRSNYQPALHDPAEVLAAGGVPRPGADRPGARRQQPQGRQARELRPGLRRHLRLLRAALLVAGRGARRAACRRSWRRGSPNIVLGAAGIVLRASGAPRSADQPIRFSTPDVLAAAGDGSAAGGAGAAPLARRAARRGGRRGSRTSTGRVRGCSTSTSRASTCAVFVLAFVALLGIFYISTFIDLADKLFGGTATTAHAAALLLFRRRRSSSTTSSRWRRWSRRWSPSAC